jgi:hypothetical protein
LILQSIASLTRWRSLAGKVSATTRKRSGDSRRNRAPAQSKPDKLSAAGRNYTAALLEIGHLIIGCPLFAKSQ